MQSSRPTSSEKDEIDSYFFGNEIIKSDLVLYCYHLLDYILYDRYLENQNDRTREIFSNLQVNIADFMKTQFRYEGSAFDKFSALRAFFNSVDKIRALLVRLKAQVQVGQDLKKDTKWVSSHLDNSVGKSMDSFFSKKIAKKTSLDRLMYELEKLDLSLESFHDPHSTYWEEKNKNLVSFIAKRKNIKKLCENLDDYFGTEDPTWNFLKANPEEMKKRNERFGHPEVAKKSKSSFRASLRMNLTDLLS